MLGFNCHVKGIKVTVMLLNDSKPGPDVSTGVNGCSLKTDANIEVVASLPSDRIMLETDW